MTKGKRGEFNKTRRRRNVELKAKRGSRIGWMREVRLKDQNGASHERRICSVQKALLSQA
jgi:hypothetical protein